MDVIFRLCLHGNRDFRGGFGKFSLLFLLLFLCRFLLFRLVRDTIYESKGTPCVEDVVMLKEIRKINDTVALYRDDRTGLAFAKDSVRGCSWSVHPSIDASGSVRGMRKLGYWGKDDKVVRCHGAYINISHVIVDDECDEILAKECMCSECIRRRNA